MTELKLTAGDAVRAMRLPPGTTITLEDHPDRPVFALTEEALDDYLAMELAAANRNNDTIAMNDVILELLRKALGPEWHRFNLALRSLPTERRVELRDEAGTVVGVELVAVSKGSIMRQLYEQIFPMYTDRPTTRSTTSSGGPLPDGATGPDAA